MDNARLNATNRLLDAAIEDNVDALIQATSTVRTLDVTNEKGTTALQLAAGYGAESAVQWLVSNKANVHLLDCEGRNALTYACCFGHAELAIFLMDHGADPNHADRNGWTPLMFAARTGEAFCVESLVERKVCCRQKATSGSYSGQTALEIAQEHHHEGISQLISTEEAAQKKVIVACSIIIQSV